MEHANKGIYWYAVLLCVAAQLICLPPAIGQTSSGNTSGAPSASAGGNNKIETVTVTAERREENIQKTPVAVTAFSSEQLSDRQLVDAKAITYEVPNTWFGVGLSDPTDIEIGIRGISTPGAVSVSDPAVPVYIDGVYIARTSGADVGLVDMSQVQVLRGPQGTLFGRNSTGGAFVITTQDPTDQFEGYASTDVGTYGTFDATGVVNIPFDDDIDGRFVYQHVQHLGYNSSLDTGQKLDSVDQNYFRGKLRFALGPHWTLQIAGDYLHSDGAAGEYKLGYMSPTFTLALGLPPLNELLPALAGHPGDLLSNYTGGGFHHNYDEGEFNYFVTLYTGTATLTGQVGGVTIKSITGYRNLNNDDPIDLDGTPYVFLETVNSPLTNNQITEELQALGQLDDGKLSWIAGLYYFQEAGHQRYDTYLLQPIVNFDSVVDFEEQNISQAAYAQITYQVLDQLSLTAGIRYNEDIRRINYHDQEIDLANGASICTLNPAVIVGSGCNAPGRVTASYAPFTVGANFTPNDDTLLYVKLSEGYRAGGFPQSTVTTLPYLTSVAPEKVLSPEVGAKMDMLDNHLRLDVDGFYENYTNLQQQVEETGSNGAPVLVQANVGDARIFGAEAEGEALIGSLSLHGSFGVQDPEYTGGPFVGTPFLFASKVTWLLGASYPLQVPGGALIFNGDYSWRSTVYQAYQPGNNLANEALRQDPYGLVDAKIAYELTNTPLKVSLWAKNLLDQDYKTRTLSFYSSFGATVYAPGDPRTVGLSATYTF